MCHCVWDIVEELLIFTFCLLQLCVIYSAHTHNLPLAAAVSSDISWIKPASAALMNPLL